MGVGLGLSSPALAGTTPPAAAAACADPTGLITPGSVDEARALMTGTWLLCNGQPLFGTPEQGEVGVELAADGHFYRIYQKPDGSLVRAETAGQTGRWGVRQDSPPAFRLVLEPTSSNSFTFGTVSLFTTPLVLRIQQDMAGPSTDLLRWTGPDPVPGVPVAEPGPCGYPTGELEPGTVAEASGLLVGTWIACDGVPLLGDVTSRYEVGVQFTPDGRLHRVYRDDTGTLIRGEGLGLQGTWTLAAVPSMMLVTTHFQLNFEVGAGTFLTSVGFVASPPFLRVTRLGGTTDLVRWLRSDPVPGPPPGVDVGGCGLPQDPVTPQSLADAQRLLVGTWEHCGGAQSVFYAATPGEAGVEFAADGTVYRLVRGPDGALVRGQGAGQVGTWEMLDTSAMNGPGHVQVNVFVDGQIAAMVSPSFWSRPWFMRAQPMMQPGADYLRVGPPPAEPTRTLFNGGVDTTPAFGDALPVLVGWLLVGAGAAALKRRMA
jgi:hypothetical protein